MPCATPVKPRPHGGIRLIVLVGGLHAVPNARALGGALLLGALGSVAVAANTAHVRVCAAVHYVTILLPGTREAGHGLL